jgi:peptidoglycan/xylan/chitin deacetylase (PgdA/CDA1 family)
MKNKAKYIIDLFKTIYKTDKEIDIDYGLNTSSKIQIKTGNVDYFQKSEELSLENIIWKEWRGERIPFLFDSNDNDIISFLDDKAIINFDIIASAFYLLSCWQEYVNKNRDKHGRFQFNDSIQYKLDIVSQPTVNYYFDILKYAMEKVYKVQLKSIFENEYDFTTFISHDIDTCESAWKQAGFWQIRHGNFTKPFKLVFSKFRGKDGWFNFDEILEIEKNLGINSTFFFISNFISGSGLQNSDYKLTPKKFQPVFENIVSHGSELGLHSGFGSHTNSEYLKNDIQKMLHKIIGNRFHYLNFEIDETPGLLQNAGFEYDSTLGFAETAGFRSSFCLPYFLYDIKNDCPTSVIEIPLVFMDSSLRLKNYMNLSFDEIISLTEKLVKEGKKFNGVFSVNWHNTRFSDIKDPGWKDVFIDIVKMCKAQNSRFLTGNQIHTEFTHKLI